MSVLLKKGITGFSAIRDFCPDENDYKKFRKICYSLQNVINMKIINTVNPDCTSYFCAEFTDNENKIYFLLNKYYNVGGFTKNLIFGDKIFTDCSNIYLNECEIIPAVILNSDFRETNHDLSKCELEQINYWKPVSVGNIIFNEWD
ncbi:MAG: hypothetical protein K2G14_08265 [Ruminococcus sp.]|nr:hypothetical protein [Ruminococcus sp.]